MFSGIRDVIIYAARQRLELADDNVNSAFNIHPMTAESMRNLNEARDEANRLQDFIKEFRKGSEGRYDRKLAEELVWERIEAEENCGDIID